MSGPSLQHRMRALAEEALALEQRREAWMNDALFDIRAGRGGLWEARAVQIAGLIDRVQPLVETLGPLTDVQISGGDIGALTALAQTLQQHLQASGAIKTAADGQPKLGAFTAKAVKQAKPLFDQVRVNGLPPVTSDQLDAFLTFVEAQRAVDALDKAWPANVEVPPEDTLQERLQWHVTELQQLQRVLALGEELAAEEQRLSDLDLKRPDWTDLETVHAYASLVDAAAAKDAWAAAAQPLTALEDNRRRQATRWSDAAACVHQLHLAVRNRDHDEYAQAHARLSRLHGVRGLVVRREDLAQRLTSAPDLRAAIADSPQDEVWDERLARFEAAWAWASTGAWILEQDTTDTNALQAQINVLEARIRREVETLAATRAWTHAVSPGRLTGQAQADLAQYAQLVRRLGKGTGKYAAQQRAEIRNAMDRCRPAVPVWIMPIYRIAEQFQVHENMFDVVIVDEASQAGVEATFLQYLAPKIVVIGDDKQVSPAAVGIDQQQLRDLANQYLADDRYKASWQDPKRSLFDEAKMRYGGTITLIEHRRCVPEIIGFSNRIAYEPDGVRLIPVRQYGADRLEPIKAVHVRDGYEKGSTAKTNPAEVDAIVDQSREVPGRPPLRRPDLRRHLPARHRPGEGDRGASCSSGSRPRSGPPATLRCGDAADFQGSERDVMFLSMVAAPAADRRLGALTQELYVQRYNVAASRAKDQLWLFHSMALQDLGQPRRHAVPAARLLLRRHQPPQCRRRPRRHRGGARGLCGSSPSTPSSSSVSSTGSFDRGYTVIPQYPAERLQHRPGRRRLQGPTRHRVRRRRVARPRRLRARPRPAARPRTLRLAVLPHPRVRLLRRPGRHSRRPVGDPQRAWHLPLRMDRRGDGRRRRLPRDG